MGKFLKLAADVLAKISIAFVIGVVMFTKLDKKISYFDFANRIYVTDVIPNMLWGVIAVILYVFVSCYGGREKKGKFKIEILWKIQMLLLIAQIYFATQIFFTPGNDAHNVMSAAENIVLGKYDSFLNGEYFQMCPNNLMLYVIDIGICKLSQISGCNAYVILVGVDIILANMAVYLIQLCMWELDLSSGICFICYVFSVVLVALSPWIVVPYTDMLSICIPILTFYIYLKLRGKSINLILKTVLVCIIPMLTYQLKVLNIIVLIAIILTEVICKDRIKGRDIIKILIGFLIAAIISMCIAGVERNMAHYKPDANRKLSVEWFLLIGSNRTSYGQWNYEDYELAVQRPATKEERQNLTYQEIRKRINTYGVVGWISHLKNKTHIFYDDATFGWCSARGSVYQMPEESGMMMHITREIFFPPDNYGLDCDVSGYGQYYMYYSSLLQGMWIVLLCGMFIFIWKPICQKGIIDMVLTIIWIGIFIFTMLFETSARLLLSYVPIFIITMGMSVKNQTQ